MMVLMESQIIDRLYLVVCFHKLEEKVFNMFLLKKIIAPLFYPLTLSMILMICGLFLLWFTRRQKMGKFLVSLAAIFLIIFSYETVSDSLLRPLERASPPFMLEKISAPSPVELSVKWIVVLGSGHISDPGLPVTGQISFQSLARLTEAVRIYRGLSGAKIILSGSAAFDPVPQAEIYFKVARIMDIPYGDLVRLDQARDTEEEARLVKDRVSGDSFILVTSACHMPRALALFEKQGLKPIPAPAAHLAKAQLEINPANLYPSALGLLKAQMAVHEYLGVLWSKCRGRI